MVVNEEQNRTDVLYVAGESIVSLYEGQNTLESATNFWTYVTSAIKIHIWL